MSNVSGSIKSIQDIMRKDVGVDGDAQRISQMVWMIFLKIYDDREEELELTEDNFRSPIPEKYRWRNWAKDREGITGDALNKFVDELFVTLKTELPVVGELGKRAQIIRDLFEDTYNYMKSGTLMRQVVNKINEIDFNNTQDRHTFGAIYEQILKDLQSAGNAGEFYTPRAVTKFIIDRLAPKLPEVVFDPACGTGGFLACAIDYKRQFVKSPEDEEQLLSTIRGVEKKALPHMLCITNMILHGIDTPSGIVHGNTLEKPYRDYGEKDRVPVIATNPPFGGMEQDGIETNFPAHLRTRETADLFMALIIKLLADFIKTKAGEPVATSNWAATNTGPVNAIGTLTPSGSTGRAYTYDANGNVLSDGIRNYTWDAENRLLTITEIATGHVSKFSYDGLGRRVAITEITGSTSTRTGYLWCGQTICASYLSTGLPLARYLANGEIHYTGLTGTNYFYAQDHLGTVTAMTNAKGATVGTLATDAYGNTTASSGTLPTFVYAGMLLHQPTSSVSPLYLTLNRAYDPYSGRWLSRDPSGEAGGINLYGYTDGEPTNGIDPDGDSFAGTIAGGAGDAAEGIFTTCPECAGPAGALVGGIFCAIDPTACQNAANAVFCAFFPEFCGDPQGGQCNANAPPANPPPSGTPPPGTPAQPNAGQPPEDPDDQNPNVTQHAQQRQSEAQSDPNRQVGDPNTVISQGRQFTDTETGNTIYVNGDRVVVTDSFGNRVTQFINSRANTQMRIRTGRWSPK